MGTISSKPHSSSVRFLRAVSSQVNYPASQRLGFLFCKWEMIKAKQIPRVVRIK